MGKIAEVGKLLALTALWLALGRVLPEVLYRVLPEFALRALSLPSYSMICQILTTGLGLGATQLAFDRPTETLGLVRATAWQPVLALLLAPVVFVLGSIIALEIAEPYLLAELATEGAGASRRNAGAFGQAVTGAPLFVTLVWGAVLAAIAEELAFRGALFRTVERTSLALLVRDEAANAVYARWIAGLFAVVVSAAVFGAMHADMKGSVGIVRVAAATFLGLACGSARLATKSVLVPMALHFGYNSISLGLARGVFRGDSDPLLSAVPNRLLALAAIGVLLALLATVARRAVRAPG